MVKERGLHGGHRVSWVLRELLLCYMFDEGAHDGGAADGMMGHVAPPQGIEPCLLVLETSVLP